MRNRAKCKLCQSIIESLHATDYVTCKCGHISVYGGQYEFKAGAIDWKNFLRVDDEGNEIIVTVLEPGKEHKESFLTTREEPKQIGYKMKLEDLLKELENMIKNIEALPSNAMLLPINHYDYLSGLMIIKAILDAKE